MTAEPRESVAARLAIAPEPAESELAAIVAALRSRLVSEAMSADGEPETPAQSRWEVVARREAVYGNRLPNVLMRGEREY